MKIIFNPGPDPHNCGPDLYNLGDLPLGTIVECHCGKHWKSVKDSVLTYVLFTTFEHYTKSKLWRKISLPKDRVESETQTD